MLFDQLLNLLDVTTAESVAAFDPDWIEPELGFACISFDMNVRWFAAIPGIEEETVGSAPQHSRLKIILSRGFGVDKLSLSVTRRCQGRS